MPPRHGPNQEVQPYQKVKGLRELSCESLQPLIRALRERVGALAARAVRAVAASLLQLEQIPVQLAHGRKTGNAPRGRGRASKVGVSAGSPSTPPPDRTVTRSPRDGGGVLPPAATLGGAPRTVNDFVLSDVPSGPAAGWISQSAKRLGCAGDSGAHRRLCAERGRHTARREVGLVSSNGRSGLPHGKSGPAPCRSVRPSKDAFPCRSLRRSRRASRQSSATRLVSAPGLMVARSSRLGHSGSNSPGRRYESSRHGLAASRPRTLGSGAVR